jgi:hypothetical protein
MELSLHQLVDQLVEEMNEDRLILSPQRHEQ